MNKCRMAVLVSGNGTNLEAILNDVEAEDIPGEVVVVISNVEDAYALVRARNHGVEARWVDPKAFPTRADYDRELVRILQEKQVDLVVLAGYMLLVGPEILGAFPLRVINLHPALLPSFPGTHGAADALAYGVKVTGVTVHFVDEGLDTGPIIMQQALAVLGDDDLDALLARIHQVEHRLYPEAIRYFCEGRLRVEGRRVFVD